LGKEKKREGQGKTLREVAVSRSSRAEREKYIFRTPTTKREIKKINISSEHLLAERQKGEKAQGGGEEKVDFFRFLQNSVGTS